MGFPYLALVDGSRAAGSHTACLRVASTAIPSLCGRVADADLAGGRKISILPKFGRPRPGIGATLVTAGDRFFVKAEGQGHIVRLAEFKTA
jgi:hypothetical protein